MCTCVVCGSDLSEDIVNIGEQYPSALFLKENDPFRSSLNPSSLNVAKCKNKECGLIQLSSPVSLTEVFERYPYESSSTISMRKILNNVKDACLKRLEEPLQEGDIILDIGGNDGTLLSLHNENNIRKVNIDAANNVEQLIKDDSYTYVNSLFSKEVYASSAEGPPKLITCIAMFYHLSDPRQFLQDVFEIMDESTVFCIQMSYAGLMMQNCVVDNIVHEHVTYYTLGSLEHLLNSCGLEAFDAELIDVYGGSIRTFIRKKCKSIANTIKKSNELIKIQKLESKLSSNEISSLINFNQSAQIFKANMNSFIDLLLDNNEKVFGFGASTKGNMMLQFLGRGKSSIRGVFDNSQKKIGTTMLGSDIEVLDEKTIEEHEVSSLISLPYYYHENFRSLIPKLYKNKDSSKLKLIRPLPEIKYTNI